MQVSVTFPVYQKLVDSCFFLTFIKMIKLNRRQQKITKKFSMQSFFQTYLIAIQSKRSFFVYPMFNSTLIDLLQCLEKDSRLSGYQVLLSEQKVKIFLNYDSAKNRPLNQKVRFYSSQGRKRMITVKMLQHFKNQYPNSLVILSTSRGLMNLNECLFYHCGGEFVVSIT
jgi:ribosomal protein S8